MIDDRTCNWTLKVVLLELTYQQVLTTTQDQPTQRGSMSGIHVK